MKNKFKLIAFLLAIICVATIAYGCGKSDSNTEITDSIPITTITASAAETFYFNFEVIDRGSGIAVFRETTTDTIWVEGYTINGIGISQFDDPETGKPLTYSVWLEKYANK